MPVLAAQQITSPRLMLCVVLDASGSAGFESCLLCWEERGLVRFVDRVEQSRQLPCDRLWGVCRDQSVERGGTDEAALSLEPRGLVWTIAGWFRVR
jgi:hypothetical protein